MVTLARVRRTVMVLSWALCFFVFATLAETVTSYSGKYAADLERKQALLDSVSEDVYKLAGGSKESANDVVAVRDMNARRLRVERIDLAEIVPPVKRFNVASISMSGTLSPRSGGARFPQKNKSRN